MLASKVLEVQVFSTVPGRHYHSSLFVPTPPTFRFLPYEGILSLGPVAETYNGHQGSELHLVPPFLHSSLTSRAVT